MRRLLSAFTHRRNAPRSSVPSVPVFNIRRFKVGGIWFLRLGRLQFSFCLCRGFNPKQEVSTTRA